MAELAREVWRERELAERLDREADELRARFDEAFWSDERGGFYVLALDRDKKQVDSLCSNIGHLLWSGIVPPERVDAVVDRLMGPDLWSGWGVRTMSSADCGLQPALVPQRHRVAARQLADCVGPRALLALAGGAADHPPDGERGRPLRLPAARGLRRPSARGHAVPDRLPDGGATAGLGGRARRCSCSRSCSACVRTCGTISCARCFPSSFPPGPAACGSPGSAPSTAPGTFASKRE